MPPEPELGTPTEWLKRARSNLTRSNLIRAQQPRPEGVFGEDLCFDAQQAAEKALKGLLIFYGIPFRFVHDIAELLTRLEQEGISLPEEVRAAAGLSPYAVGARYPGPTEPVTEEDYREAVVLAETIVRWAEQLVQAGEEGEA